jgi:hypothetical protein
MQEGFYNRAFFGLSVGLERLLKLILLLNHGTTHGGEFPSNSEFKRSFGHDLGKLFVASEAVRGRLQTSGVAFDWHLPDRRFADLFLGVLSEFATQSRYYNLDLLTGAAAGSRDPVRAWAEDVGSYLEGHYPQQRKARDEARAAEALAALGSRTSIAQETELGEPIPHIGESVRHSLKVEYVQAEATFQTVRVIRYLAEILTEANHPAQAGGLSVPYLWEFFAIFNNPDRVLKRRKTFNE